MGRSSSTGFPYLVGRADAGQFTSQRTVPDHLNGLVVGDVRLAWAGRTRDLRGTTTIKISLSTGDLATARQRWAAIHPQVDALVQLAEVRARNATRPDTPANVPRLDPAQFRMIAGQAYHNVLATDDRGQVEPGFVTPVAGIILDLLSKRHAGDPDRVKIAELAARKIEQSMHRERLRRRDTAILDAPIEVSELEACVLDSLTSGLKPGDRLAPEQVEALAHGIRIDVIPSEVEKCLEENGLDLPDDHVDRRSIALAITRAKLRALNDVGRRDRGAPIETPERPAVMQPARVSPAKPVPLLSAMQTRWIDLARPGNKQIGDSSRYLRLFISLHGGLPVDQIMGTHVRAFRDMLLVCPRNAPQRMAKASLEALADWARQNPTKPRLGRPTINAKGLGTLATLLEQARKDELITSNPAQGQQLAIRASDTQERRPYTDEELATIFRTAIYGAEPIIPEGGKLWAAWWLPLLSLFTGARLEELGQALVSDIRRKHGIDYIEVTTVSDDDAASADKALKTEAERRRIPLHATLIQSGFLDYVAFVKASGATRLFPDLDQYRGRTTKNWSRWWGRWLTKLGMTNKALTFHSFRHSFTAELRRHKCGVSIMKELLGHAQSDVTSGYGRTEGFLHELGDLNDEIQRIAFRGLDLSHLADLRPWSAKSS